MADDSELDSRNGLPAASSNGAPPGRPAKPAIPVAPGVKGTPARPAGPPTAGAARPAKPAIPGRPTLPPGAPEEGGDGGPSTLSRKDFVTDQDVRWCPGCGDYAVLATMQRLMPGLGIPRENIVFVSGIGCSSRFPYYMNTYGFHSIHGRAPAIATGIKACHPELDVWIVTGDGDALSIGGNHLIHLMRRNQDVQVLLFNNQIYGLTKGQYSPTSERGKVTTSTPYGSIDNPFNPIALALGAESSFVARTMDRDPKHMQEILKRAHLHRGTAFVEIYQNCNIFNDGAFFTYTEKDTKAENALFIEHGKPLVFDGSRKGIRLEGFRPKVVDLTNGSWSADDCLVFDETCIEIAGLIARMFLQPGLPRPFGVFFREDRPTYGAQLHAQIDEVTRKQGKGDLEALLRGGETWEIR